MLTWLKTHTEKQLLMACCQSERVCHVGPAGSVLVLIPSHILEYGVYL